MKQSAKRLLSSLFALVAMVASFVIFFNFVQGEYIEVNRLRGEMEGLRQAVADQKQIIDKIKSLRGDYEGSEDARLQVALALPDAPMMAEALAQIDGIAGANRLAAQTYGATTDITLGTSEADRRRPVEGGQGIALKPLGTISFQIRVIGSYEDFKEFIDDIQTNIRILDVKTVSVQPVAGRGNANAYLFELKVAAYYQKQN